MRHNVYFCDMETTEQKIMDAAIETFNVDLSASLEKVAAYAGLTRRTVQRYFADRATLMEACREEMQRTCRLAMTAAYNSTNEPVKQLEQMLYAGIDCGSKYAFLDKLHQRPAYDGTELPEDSDFDNIRQKWFRLVHLLQKEGLINAGLSPAWIFGFFGSVISATINVVASGNVARNDVKRFAWFSFSRGVGIRSRL